MSNASDFVIEKGTLKKYKGKAADVEIPEDVKRIAGKGVGTFDFGAFALCKKLKSITIQSDSITIEKEAFFGCDHLTSITMMSSDADINKYAFLFVDTITTVFAPRLSHAELKACGLGMPAARTFIERYQEYTNENIVKDYIAYIAAQRKKLLPVILEHDAVGILRLLADAKKITKKNAEQEYLLPAMQCKARECVAFLESMFGQAANAQNAVANINELWDGKHFSLDGKKLLKYPEEPGRIVYEVPDGTVEICKNAFCFTKLEQIILPESVTTVRNDSFAARDDCPLFIRFPKSLQKIPASIFLSSFEEDYSRKYYYVSTPISGVAAQICMDSEYDGHGRIIYTGGPIDDLPSATKKYAVLGLIYAEQHGLEDLSPWRESYCQYLKKNQKTAVKLAAEDNNILQWMLHERLFTENGAEMLLNEAETNGRTDMTAALLEYQQKHFGDKSSDALSLSDDDPEFKRMQKIAARRETIKDQKGIKGIVFVQTGDMMNFGYYDEYTGAKDMSDLKEFIEARGGFLRSAVSSNTDYLICNDPNSDTVKSKKAKELGVPVITEEQFLKIAEEKE